MVYFVKSWSCPLIIASDQLFHITFSFLKTLSTCLFYSLCSEVLHTKPGSTKSLIFNGAASQSVSWWRHRQEFLAAFTQKSWNCCIYKCSAPGLWAINTAPCCISTATSSKLSAFTLCFSHFTKQMCCTEVLSILSIPKNKMQDVRMPVNRARWNDCSAVL